LKTSSSQSNNSWLMRLRFSMIQCFLNRRDHHSLLGIRQEFETEIVLPLDPRALILVAGNQDQGRRSDPGRIEAETLIGLDQTGEILHLQAEAPRDRLIGAMLEG
jgi:hypothetical protein